MFPLFPKKLVRMELVIWFAAILVYHAVAPVANAQDNSDFFSIPAETVQPIPSQGRSVLYLLYTLADTHGFEIKPEGLNLGVLDGYVYRGQQINANITLRDAIQKILRDSGAVGVKPMFTGNTLILSGTVPQTKTPATVRVQAEDKPEPGLVKPAEQIVAQKPADTDRGVENTKPVTDGEKTPVSRAFTQPEEIVAYSPHQLRIADTMTSYPPSARPGMAVSPWPTAVTYTGYGQPTNPAIMNLDSNSPGYVRPRYHNNTYGYSRTGYSPYGYGNYYGGYYNPYINAEWCANFPANRLCTHGQIKIDGPELSQVDMYLTPLSPKGEPLGPRSNLGPVSKHNSFFNKGYYVPAGIYRVEFINKGERLVLFKDTIRVEPAYVNDNNPQVFKVDKKRFQYEPLTEEIIRPQQPRILTVEEWNRR